jgi:GNAT superfamily N-acetyltransferase
MGNLNEIYKKVKYVGYFPGVIGKITETHAIYYHKNWGFDITFETQVGKELSEFLMEFQKERDGLWVAMWDNLFAGSIAIDGRMIDKEGARLRWFLVLPEFQGKGIGKGLISKAMEFCKSKNYKRIFLWTFEGLNVARFLYEREGFILSEERNIFQWGQNIKEQKFELNIYP